MIHFEVGKTYYTRSSGDHNCIFAINVVSRTGQTIKAVGSGTHNRVKTLRVKVYEGTEYVKPLGSYSMAPIINATDTRVLLTDWDKVPV